MEIRYVSREMVKAALDYKETARSNTLVDLAIEGASRDVESLTHRKFYPLLATRSFDWPNSQYSRSWRLWLNQHELITLVSVQSGGINIAPGDIFLYPTEGPPFTRLELNLDSASAFGLGATHQNDISVTAEFGYAADELTAGALAGAANETGTDLLVTNSAVVGVGDLIRIDTERMLVAEKTMADSGQTLQVPLTASNASVSVAVSDGTQFYSGETILLDGERMLIVDITGDVLVVKRAWDGSTLATHTGSSVYVPRILTVVRGACGTTATSHFSVASVRRHDPPSLIQQYVKALAIDTVLQDSSGWARVSGSGENERETSGRGIAKLRDRVQAAYGRMARKAAV